MSNLSGLAELLLALAGLVTSIGGAAAAIIGSIRGGRRQRAVAENNNARDKEAAEAVDADDVRALVEMIEKMKNGDVDLTKKPKADD